MLQLRNVRLFLAYRATTRAILFAPYIQKYMTLVRGMDVRQYGILQAIYYIVTMATEVPSGVLADRLGRRRTLFLGAVTAAAGCFVFAVARDFWTFALGEVLFALSTALVSGADSAFLYDTLAAEGHVEEYARAEGLAQAMWLWATVIGLPLADWFLVRGDDAVLTYWVTGGLALVGAVCALGMREPPLATRLSAREITVGALKDLRRSPQLVRIVLYSVTLFVLLRAAMVLFYNPVLDAAAVPTRRFGIWFALVNVAGALTAARTHRLVRRYGERAVVITMPLMLLAMFLGLAFVRVPVVAALFVLQGVVFGAYPLVIRTMLNREIPSAARRATVLSLESMACRVVFGLLICFSGDLRAAAGLTGAILITAALAFVPLLFLRRRERRV